MTQELLGKTAFVTGAASGIGAACSIEFARAGAKVFLADLNPSTNTLTTIQNVGGRATCLECDVSDEGSVRSAFAAAMSEVSSLDIVLNSAGILIEKNLVDMSVEDFDHIVSINVRGCFLVGREALQIMDRQGHGRMMTISSELAHLGREGFSAYCATKTAVIGLTRSWAREFAPTILVNSIAPGPIDTPMLDLENLSTKWRDKEADVPLRRVGKPQEIATVARFLANPDNSYMTGQTINVNGGAVLL